MKHVMMAALLTSVATEAPTKFRTSKYIRLLTINTVSVGNLLLLLLQ